MPAAAPTAAPLALPDHSTLSIDAGGVVTRTDKRGRETQFAMPLQSSGVHSLEPTAFGPAELARASWQHRHGRYLPGHVIVVFRSGVSGATVANQLARHASNFGDAKLDAAFHTLRATSMTPLFGKMQPSRLSLATQRARAAIGGRTMDLTQAYDLRIGASSPIQAANLLLRSSSVAYAEPDFYVSTMLAHDGKYAPNAQQKAVTQARSIQANRRTFANTGASNVALPTNYGLQSSLSAFLNANNLDWTPAYTMLEQKYGQLPGQGEIITNVSIGDITDASQGLGTGSTTTVIGGQRYLDVPSMPLIPTYVADENSNLDPTGTAVNTEDPLDGEILLDFSVMAPLPDSLQRAGRQGSGLLDLLGIAPGAQYRLIVPQVGTFSNIGAALLAASQQQPAPNVITASLGFGTDGSGFPGRYLEDDPILQSIVASIVNQGIVVCIAANDGTRLVTNVAVNPDGGSTPTDLVAANGTPTTIDDVAFSTTPSLVADSGALDVGSSTLDDTIAWDPYNPGPLSSVTALAETRISGLTAFSSGFGARVNVSAPGDAIPAMQHAACYNCTAQDVDPANEAGTSASSPEVAASVAVILQAARLAGKTLTPAQVRDLLESTGRAVPTAPQIDRQLNVGPLVDIGAAVSSLLGPSTAAPSVPRVAIAQRQEYGLGGGEFEENTDPSLIDLNGPYVPIPTGTNNFSPITIAPDWVGIPNGTKYALFVTGHPSAVLATTPWARLMPSQILGAAGLSLVSSQQRTVSLTYRASQGVHIVREATFSMTFSSSDGLTYAPPAPVVPATVQAGQSVTVSYDLTHAAGINAPQLIVSNVDHWSFASAPFYRITYAMRLLNLKGSVTLPASAFVGGAGLYGIAIEQDSVNGSAGHVAPILVTETSAARPDAPTLAANATDAPSHGLGIVRPQTAFYVNYDVTKVPNSNGAILEISAAGPNIHYNYNNFNNPFGSQQDNNGFDTPSTVYQQLGGVKGSAQFDADRLGLASSMFYVVRVLATNGGNVIGTASPVSTLQFTDQFTPGGAPATGFDIEPGGTSSVSTYDYWGVGATYVYPYTTSTETYGSPWYSDTTGINQAGVFGGDASLKRTALWTYNASTGENGIEAIDQTTGQVLGSATVTAGAYIPDQTVDSTHHRALFISNHFGTSSLVPFDLQTFQTGNAITLGNSRWSRAGAPGMLTVDQSTGTPYVMSFYGGDFCRQNSIASVDLVAGTVSAPSPIGFCDRALQADGMGQNVYVADGAPYSVFSHNTPLKNDAAEVNAQSLAFTQMPATAGYGATITAVDSVNHVLLVGYLGSPKGPADNSGAGTLVEFSTTTGQLIKTFPSFSFGYLAGGFAPLAGGIQLDPATRTGWTYGPDGAEIRQFSY